MSLIKRALLFSIALYATPVGAQCFSRSTCGDPNTIEVRSQITVNVPLADQASSSDSLKAMEDARRDLYGMSNRECDALKAAFGGDCTLSSMNVNSSMQDRGMRPRSALISIANTYVIKKSSK